MFKPGDYFVLTKEQIDHDDEDEKRITPVGSVFYIDTAGILGKDPPFQCQCPVTGGLWFMTEAELDAEAKFLISSPPTS